MNQTFYENPDFWPVPRGAGVLVEILFQDVTNGSDIITPTGSMRNTSAARVRAVSPAIGDLTASTITSDRTPGAVGATVVVSEPNLRYLKPEEYRACGLEMPSEDNGYGDLAHINYPRIISVMDEQTELQTFDVFVAGKDEPLKTVEQYPYRILGKRVFFEYDYDEDSVDTHQTEGGIHVPEKALAADNLMATVIGVGHKCEQVKLGDRVVVKRFASQIPVDGTTYNFVGDEDEIISVLEPAR
jgi:co-chaperonin GroES (HSP10)